MNISTLKQNAINNNVPIIKDETKQILVDDLIKHKPLNVVEIGTAIGYSSLIIANTIQDWNGILTTFEVSYPSYMEAVQNFQAFGQYNITAYNLDPLLVDLKKIFTKKIDFIFIDAVMKMYLDFYLHFEDLLENNCIIYLDNVVKFKSKTTSLYEFIEKNQIQYQLFEIPPNDGLMKIVK